MRIDIEQMMRWKRECLLKINICCAFGWQENFDPWWFFRVQRFYFIIDCDIWIRKYRISFQFQFQIALGAFRKERMLRSIIPKSEIIRLNSSDSFRWRRLLTRRSCVGSERFSRPSLKSCDDFPSNDWWVEHLQRWHRSSFWKNCSWLRLPTVSIISFI